MSQGKHNSLSLARPPLFLQGRLSSAFGPEKSHSKKKKEEDEPEDGLA